MTVAPLLLALLLPWHPPVPAPQSAPQAAPQAAPKQAAPAGEAPALPGFDEVFGYPVPDDGAGANPSVWSYRLTDIERRIWSDPAFKRRFAESYLAETDVEPRVTQLERDQMLKVLELISADKLGEAVTLLHAQGGEAASAVFDFTLGNIHFQKEESEQAAAAYEAAVGKFPRFRRAWRNLALIRARQNDDERTALALTRVIELGGADAVSYGLLGIAYTHMDDNLAGETAFRQAILLDPATRDWRMGLAQSLFKQRRYPDAASLLGKLIEDEPERADLWLLQANAFIGLHQPERAAENYELVDRMGLSTADSLNMLGDIYVNQELYELATSAYLRGLDKAPEAGAERALRAAKVLTARGALDGTRAILERITSGVGGPLETEAQKDLLKLRARLAVADGAGEEEAKVLEEIVALDPLDGEALILLGQHAARNDDVERAIFWYERAEGLEAHEADAKVRHAQLLVNQGRYAEALPLLRRAQVIEPRDSVQQYLEQVERVAQAR